MLKQQERLISCSLAREGAERRNSSHPKSINAEWVQVRSDGGITERMRTMKRMWWRAAPGSRPLHSPGPHDLSARALWRKLARLARGE